MEKEEIQPLEAIYMFMMNNEDIEIHEKEGNMVHRGKISGFDEYMNIVINTGHSKYLLKGDCILSINKKKPTIY